jgi:hypothetical protein
MVRVTKISVVVNLPLWRGEMERKLFVDIPWYVIHQSKCPRVYFSNALIYLNYILEYIQQ